MAYVYCARQQETVSAPILAPVSDNIAQCDNPAGLGRQCRKRARSAGTDKTGLSLGAIPGTDKPIRLYVAFISHFYRHALSGLFTGAEFSLYGRALRI